MPPVRGKNGQKKVTPEEQRIAKEIKDIQDSMYKNAAAASRVWHVLYDKLLRRSQGMQSVESNGRYNKALSAVQEKVLLLYIDRCEEMGRPCEYRHIETAANSILQASDSPRLISRCWTSRFIKRIKIYRHCTKPLSVQQKAAQKRNNIELYFEKFDNQYQELEIKPENLYNFDETGFRIGYLAGQIVFTQTDRQVYISDPDNCKLVISIESISAIGKTTDPILIIPGQQIKEKHFPKGLNNRVWIAVSKSGYTNDILSLE
jgi:hypothetical protein